MSSREIIFSAAGAAGAPATYIEDVFSTWLYTGTGSTQTITNNIDLAGEGGMVWIKGRNNTQPNALQDTSRGAGFILYSNDTSGQDNYAGFTGYIDQFNANGFQIKSGSANWNVTNNTYASWTFRKQPKFFDVVTYTGNGVNGRTIAHSLGSVPGMIIVKRTSSAQDWVVWHRSLTAGNTLFLNYNVAASYNADIFTTTSPTSSVFSVGFDATTNTSGQTYVAYLFAHNAGGFGLTGTDNVISCGSYTGNGSSQTITLGYEPQFLLIKNATTGATNWLLLDVMRGMPVSGTSKVLYPNTSDAEANWPQISPTATGFTLRNDDGWLNGNGDTYIYMAIRRGPMKTPTSATSVFSPIATTPNANNFAVTTSNLVDMIWSQAVTSSGGDNESYAFDRLRGCSTSSQPFLKLSATSAQVTQAGQGMGIAQNTGYIDNWFFWNYGGGRTIANWAFTRAPGFFDVVCYTGDGVTTGRQVTHNLGVAPEFIIVKSRSNATNWTCYVAPLTASGRLTLNTDLAVNTTTPALFWGNGTTTVNPTSTVFTLGSDATALNQAGSTYVAYLFATVAGVSKVGSYTGTGSTQTINAGLPTGARFVLIKRTDSTGSWWIWDTARGMVAGTDPRLALETQSSQINNNWVYTVTNGFQIVTSDATVNASGGSYIYLAIA